MEIAPLVSYAGEGLQKLKGLTLKCPLIISNDEDLERLARESKKAKH